jgi:hypothetical protein
MKTIFTIRHFHTDLRLWAMVLLTLLLVFLPKQLRADDKTAMIPEPLISTRPSNSALDNADRGQRIGLLLDYVRHEGPALMPGLPDALREPVHYAMEQLKSTGDTLGLTGGDGSGGGFLSPVFSLMQPPDNDLGEALWVSPGYHHLHGMLPFDDALMMGFTYRDTVMNKNARFDVHPFYAQSWHCMEGYWGIETTLALFPSEEHPWGTIALRYDNGNTDLMDRNHGFDMRADLHFDRRLSLTAGAQQNEASDLGDYVLLRWRMSFEDK